jgi:hypothetical protein
MSNEIAIYQHGSMEVKGKSLQHPQSSYDSGQITMATKICPMKLLSSIKIKGKSLLYLQNSFKSQQSRVATKNV